MKTLHPCHLSKKPFGFSPISRRARSARCASIELQAAAIVYEVVAPLVRSSVAPAQPQLCTLVTQCSLDRWPRFAQQAESWEGAASVAVYIPAPKSSTAADAALQLLQTYADDYIQNHPQQSLTVSALYANHFAREGASVLTPTGTATDHLLSSSTPADQTKSTPNTLSYDQLYPINALRNLALQQANSPLVLSLDSDFIISQGLHAALQAPQLVNLLGLDNVTCYITKGDSEQKQSLQALQQQRLQQDYLQQQEQKQEMQQFHSSRPEQQQMQSPIQQLFDHTPQQDTQPSQQQQQGQQQQGQQGRSKQQPVMLVLPAFQLSLQQDLADTETAVVPKTKHELAAALAANTVEPFHCGAFPPAYQPVDVRTWSAANQPYEVQYVEYYEPQGVAVRDELPLYDERFRGYGLNKVQHAWHMYQQGFRLLVLPDAFMVTAPHKRNPSWRPMPGTAHDQQHLARIRAVYQQFKDDLAQQKGTHSRV